MSKNAALPAQTPSAPTQALDQHGQEQLALLNAFIVTVHHFLGGFTRLCRPIHDPRHPIFTIYPLPAVCFAAYSGEAVHEFRACRPPVGAKRRQHTYYTLKWSAWSRGN